jgi:hypothetical protein
MKPDLVDCASRRLPTAAGMPVRVVATVIAATADTVVVTAADIIPGTAMVAITDIRWTTLSATTEWLSRLLIERRRRQLRGMEPDDQQYERVCD